MKAIVERGRGRCDVDILGGLLVVDDTDVFGGEYLRAAEVSPRLGV